MNHHMNDRKECPLCEEKAATLHPKMLEAWWLVKGQFPESHISWAFRNESQQNEMVTKGLSKSKWPLSAHNFMENGAPCAKAFDIFVLDKDGTASFPPGFYYRVADFLKKQKVPIEWSGTWKNFVETNHYELKQIPG